jgi:hypothetical protein
VLHRDLLYACRNIQLPHKNYQHPPSLEPKHFHTLCNHHKFSPTKFNLVILIVRVCLVWISMAPAPPPFIVVLLFSTVARSHFASQDKKNKTEDEPVEPHFVAPPALCYSVTTVFYSARARAIRSCAKQTLIMGWVICTRL